MLELRNLDKSFGALNVTKDVSVSVSATECHALIGPNGAGKTTLIHQISGVLQPDRGAITLDGLDLLPLTMEQRAQAGLSRTFQITSVLPSFSVLENVAIAVQAKSGASMSDFWRAAAGDKRNTHPEGKQNAGGHDAIFQLSDRVSVLVDGAVVATGTPQDIREDPIARAAYLGEDAA